MSFPYLRVSSETGCESTTNLSINDEENNDFVLNLGDMCLLIKKMLFH